MNRFPRGSRLSGGATYLLIFRTGQRSRSAYFNVFSAPSTSTTTRLGVAISKRYVARAVDRNRVKRIIRESFRLNSHLLGSTDVIVQANAIAARADALKLFAGLAALWNEVARYRDHNNKTP